MKYAAVMVLAIAVGPACKSEDEKPIEPAVWLKDHGAEVEAVRAKFDAAAALIKDLPATSTYVADPTPPFVLQQQPYKPEATAALVTGFDMRGLPEYGTDVGKPSEQNIKYPIYFSSDDYTELFKLVDKPSGSRVATYYNNILKDLKALRYVLVTRQVSYQPGSVDVAAKTFAGGTYSGVAHLVDLQGPKLLGSVAYSAQNTGKFESYEGNEKLGLQADLRTQVRTAFRTEWRKVFPKLVLPPDPQ